MKPPPVAWTCPDCNRATALTSHLYDVAGIAIRVRGSRHGHLGINWTAIQCPNPECGEFVIDVSVGTVDRHSFGIDSCATHVPIQTTLVARRLWPEGSSLPQPAYIPEQIRGDYHEGLPSRNGVRHPRNPTASGISPSRLTEWIMSS